MSESGLRPVPCWIVIVKYQWVAMFAHDQREAAQELAARLGGECQQGSFYGTLGWATP